MKLAAMSLGMAIAATLPSLALAGPCSDRIAQMEKRISAMDAGSGPSSGATASGGTTSADSTGSVSSGANTNLDQGQPNARNAQVPKAGEAPKTGATVSMNEITSNRAASPQDVRQQLQNEPTTGQAAQSGQIPNDRQGRINTLIQEARAADQQNDQAKCDSALRELDTLAAGTR
jgi:hypothetical protein